MTKTDEFTNSRRRDRHHHSDADVIDLARKACTYLDDSPDPFHAVANSAATLEAAGFVRLDPRRPFSELVEPGGRYYYDVNGGTLVALAVGPRRARGDGFRVIAGHTDSPNLRVRPRSSAGGAGVGGCVRLGVDCYGGGLWHTWFDRDLGVSGRVLVRSDDGARVERRFVRVRRPVARVSSLCIHLETADERAAFKVNKEQHLSPVLATRKALEEDVAAQLNGHVTAKDEDEDEPQDDHHDDGWTAHQEPLLLKLVAEELDVPASRIVDLELSLYDVQPAAIGGASSEFLYSARLDNLATCFVAVESLVDRVESETFANAGGVDVVVLFDHEEVGSESAHGAASPVVADVLCRVSAALDGGHDPDVLGATVRNSFLFSVDMAHAVHPNYAAKHEARHAPEMNAGVVIKRNQNQRYATDAATGFVAREVARRAGAAPLQEFVVRNDCPCGSTIGPVISAATGVRAVDLGMPQLSMHSCREVMGITDLTNCFDLFNGFFRHFDDIYAAMEGEDVICARCPSD